MNLRLVVLSSTLWLSIASHCFAQSALGSSNWGLVDGSVVIRSPEPIEDIYGVEFRSVGGFFLPIDPPDPSPFEFFLRNSEEHVVIGTLSETTIPTHWDTGIGYSGPVSEIEDDVFIGIGADVTFTYCDRPGLPVGCVPEPTSAFLLCVPLLGLGWTRKRRKA